MMFLGTVSAPSAISIADVPTISREEGVRREVLLGAAQAIDQYGWIDASLGNKYAGFCIVGAVYHAADVRGHISDDEAGMSPYDLVPRYLGTKIVTHDWNDSLSSLEELRPVIDGKKLSPGETVSWCLRRMANGMDFKEAKRVPT